MGRQWEGVGGGRVGEGRGAVRLAVSEKMRI